MNYFNEKQYSKLSKLLCYLKNNSGYYREKLAGYSEEELVDENKIKEIYENLEITTKNGILDSYDEYLDDKVVRWFKESDIPMKDYLLNTKDLNKNHDKVINVEKIPFTVETTSGTTGKPFPIVKSSSERMIAANYLLKRRKDHNPNANVVNGFLLAHEVDDYLKDTNYLDEKSDMHEVVDYFIEKKPEWIFVTANTIKRFVRAIEKFNKQEAVRNVGVKFIEVTAAKLDDDEKKHIEQLFNAPIRNQYGCREVWNIAYECKCGNMHMNNSNLMVDIVDKEGKTVNEENCTGEVVVTSLYNKMTPFVKYYLGDYASISTKKCECGNTEPILTLQGGRKCERLKNTPYFGTSVFRRVLRVLYFNKGLRYGKVKIVQDEEFHLSVYVEKCFDFELFKKKFSEISAIMIENFSEFELTFIEGYPFEAEKNFLKENVFLSKVN